jgi:hypothetical protein
MILAIFVIVGITGFAGGEVALQAQGYSADNACSFGPASFNGPINLVVPANSTKNQIEAAAKLALEGAPCYITFGSGDSVKLIP